MLVRRILFISILFLVVGCAPQAGPRFTPTATEQAQDGGLISKKPCGPPCFYGVVPGSTTEPQIDQLRADRGDIFSNCHAFDFVSTGGSRGLNCDTTNVGYEDHTVSMISFRPSIRVAIQQIIETYGEPNAVAVGIVSLPDYPDRTAMSLYYDQIHTMLGPGEQEGSNFTVGPNTLVSIVVYLSDKQYEESRNVPGLERWRGFGSYVGTR